MRAVGRGAEVTSGVGLGEAWMGEGVLVEPLPREAAAEPATPE